ncbi:hypothetical protein QAD02_021007 [Eretmocerus hayati]|uniref:Uncharacterized protein n=1 Tax=Eretmocerus hayati TaxID=131215 RepID=A0ACC2PPI0_9HYME|nr:hypothetical protein QAD02_021007 [Eretmocerus hayati]
MNEGYVKASSQNLPRVDLEMLIEYISTSDSFQGCELRNVKTTRSMRANYGDVAIGYVQLKRDGTSCTVQGKICPEHRVHSKNYTVHVVINEEEEIIEEAQCLDCAASEGGCKHAVALLAWIYRKSEEPPPTSVTCYWKKPVLSSVGTNIKYYTIKEMVGNGKGAGVAVSRPSHDPLVNSVLRRVLQHNGSTENNCHLVQFYSKNTVQKLSLHHLAVSYDGDRSCSKSFLDFCKEALTPENCDYIFRNTATQSNCMSWFELRYGRLTASIIHEAAVCKTPDGSLVEKILSMSNYDNPAMERGRRLESQVRYEVQKLLIENWNEGKVRTSGLILSRNFPALGASPDGLTETAVVEIKCPSKEKTIANYHDGKNIKNKYKAQIQLQMIFSGRRIGFFCIAAPDFETSRKVTIYKEIYDQAFTLAVMRRAMIFWTNNVFPHLMRK